MKKITNAEDLSKAIKHLEAKQFSEGVLLKEHFFIAYDSIQPINIIKTTLKEMVQSSELKTNLSKLVFGSVSGIIAKKIVIGETHNPISKLMGVAVEMLVSKSVIKNADQIKTIGLSVLNKILNRPKDLEEVE